MSFANDLQFKNETEAKGSENPFGENYERVEMKKKVRPNKKKQKENESKKGFEKPNQYDESRRPRDILRANEQGQFDSRMLSPFRMGNTPAKVETTVDNSGPRGDENLPNRVTFIPY